MLRIVEQGISAAAIAELEQVLGEMELALREGDTTGIAEADLRFHEVIVLRSGSERLDDHFDSALKTIAGTLDPPTQNGEGR